MVFLISLPPHCTPPAIARANLAAESTSENRETHRVYAWTSLIVFIAQTLDGLLTLYLYVVIISALMTWIEPNPYNPIVRFIYSITEPVFDWFRNHLPVIFGGIDFSPLIVIIGIQLIQRVVIPSVVHALIPAYA
jgi:YggT family protein